MKDRRTILALACVVAVVAACAWRLPGAGAQQSTPAQQGAGATETLQIYSQLTVVDVTATDSAGNPVLGLMPHDFTILEDGDAQPIRNFEEVRENRVQPPPPLPPNVYTDLQPPTPSSAVNILLLDLLNEAPVDDTNARQLSRAVQMQHFVKQAAVQAVQKMPEGTRVMVLAMTNNLRILQSFTSDKALLAAAINAVQYDLEGTPMGGIQANNRNESVLEVLKRIATDSAPIHGRKNLIWFTVGIPQITFPNALNDYSRELSDTYDMLTAAQVSVYPVDARGVGPLGVAQLSEQMVAEATGGVAYWESNDLAAQVVDALNNGANYYSLAYIPPNIKSNGEYHKIEVKVDRPGVKLTYRKGYYTDDFAKIKMKPGLTITMTPPPAPKGDMKAPMSRGQPTSSDVLFDVDVQPSDRLRSPDAKVLGTLNPSLIGRRLTRYDFQYAVPGQQIAFKDGKKGAHDGNLDLDIAVYDSNDRLLTGLSQIIKMSLSDDRYQKMIASHEPIKFTQQIDLPPGQLFLRVGVLDHNSDKVGTLELPLNVGRK